VKNVVLAAIPLALLISACEGKTLSTPSSAMSAPTVQGSAPEGVRTTAQLHGHTDVRVNMLDACDPGSFDAVLGDGACARSGGIKFDQFISLLTQLGVVGPWHFAPNNANVPVGATFVATNMGGEVHTFTEVAQYGGGIVPSLNQLAHVPDVAPECRSLEADDFVAPGRTYTEQVDEAGTVKFQCCIHPWMRLEAQVASR